jgi:effector-binding domain-containing protein
MILHMGVRTTDPVKVAYRPLAPGEDEAKAIAEMLGEIASCDYYSTQMSDHSIVFNFDKPGDANRRRELMIPVSDEFEGIETKVLPSIRAAFVVFKGTDTTIEEYYEMLKNYIRRSGLEPAEGVHDIEIMYVPEDLDNVDYSIEIMIPLKP